MFCEKRAETLEFWSNDKIGAVNCAAECWRDLLLQWSSDIRPDTAELGLDTARDISYNDAGQE